jgi:hypothetical protein
MRMRALAAGGLASIVAMALGGPAAADTAKLRDLLNEGYVIRSTNVINADVIQRAVNNAKWVDDYLVTLQRGNQIAFCHVALGATLDAATFVDQATCSYSSEPAPPGSAGPVPLAPLPSGAGPQGSGTSK